MIQIFGTVAAIALAPLLHGAMKSLRAILQGRPGPPPLQPYRDLHKLWRKEALLPEGVSWIAYGAPGVAFGVALTFVAALPFVPHAPVDGAVDAIALALLLGLDRFMLALAAIDSRSAFAGMAASREATVGALVEPTLLIALLGAAAFGGGSTIDALLTLPFGPASVLAFVAFFLVTLAETARVPIDNQETHYELTMIHEGLQLEYSGWQLALLRAAAYVKQVGFVVLASMLLPGDAFWARVGWVVAIACAIALVETALAKVRLFEIPSVLSTAFILAATSIGLRIAGALV